MKSQFRTIKKIKPWYLPYISPILGQIEVSINGGTPKWMLSKGKSHQNGWFRGTTISGNPQNNPLKTPWTPPAAPTPELRGFQGPAARRRGASVPQLKELRQGAAQRHWGGARGRRIRWMAGTFLQENPGKPPYSKIFHGKSMASCRFSLKPIHWTLEEWSGKWSNLRKSPWL